ncbi:MAG: adaptor protein MecA [Lachnospiraceae bacterium]|nr:adaptor protein MecA [Lachnospiraceae bacterium]
MRIERCSDSELHCFLSKEDLQARNLRLDTMAYGTPETTALIRDLMQWASYKFNFNPDHTPLMIEAVPVSEDSLLLIVKTVSYPEEMDSRFSDFTDSPAGDVYADEDDDEEGDYADEDDFWPDGDGDDSYQPGPAPVPGKPKSAHEILEQFTDNAHALQAASEAISKLAEGVLSAAGAQLDENGNIIEAAEVTEADADDAPAANGTADTNVLEETAAVDEKPAEVEEIPADQLGEMVQEEKKEEEPAAVSAEKEESAEPAAAANAEGKGKPAISAENFAEVLQKVLDAARKSGSTANYIRMFRFNSIDEITDIAPFISTFYGGPNYLYKDGGVYHLLLSMDGENPLNYNKLINIMNEFAAPEPVNPETTSFMDEHENLILAGHAIQKLAEISGKSK